jgi:hypothetical protein
MSTTTMRVQRNPGNLLTGAWDQTTWRAQGYLALGLFTGVLGLLTFILVVAFGAAFSALIIGVPALLPILALSRGMAELERRRNAVLLDAPIEPPYPVVRGGLLARIGQWLAAPSTWRDLAHHLLALPVNLFAFAVSLAFWSAGLGAMSFWAWYWSMPNDRIYLGDHHLLVIHSVSSALPWIAVGLALCWIAGWLTRGLATMTAAFNRLLLGYAQNGN